MKPADHKILQYIRNNARTNLTTISRKTGIPVSTIFDRIRAHEAEFVTKFTAILDFAKLGFPVKTHIFLRVDAQHRDTLKSHLLMHERVNNLFRVNNGFDFAAECVFDSIRDVEEFVESLELHFKITGKQVYYIIDDIAREKMLSLQP